VPPTPSPRPQPSPTTRSISVPQLRGKTLPAAQKALEADGLTSTVRGVNVNIDKDVVADQQPDAGASLPPGGTVTILVGTGSTAIPDVANQPREQAAKTLQDNSFRVTVRQRRDSRPEGVAIETRPPAGTVAPRNSVVELTVSG
jgi:beta-lactam-binding protein with PASTA domain